jgi:GNAT superfamily N-acetyltransferase
MAITVRPGNAGDMQAALPLMLGRLRERASLNPALSGLKDDAEKRFRQWLGPAMEDPRHALFVAEDDGEMVGCLVALVEKDLPIYEVEEYAAVRMLWAAPGPGGRDVAGRLLAHAARHYEKLGVRQVRVALAPGREDEHRAAEKAGLRAAAVTYVSEPAAAR